MKGLCHSCLTSNTELIVFKDKILCKSCLDKLQKQSPPKG